MLWLLLLAIFDNVRLKIAFFLNTIVTIMFLFLSMYVAIIWADNAST
jgi:hypothetical protein